MKKLIQAFLQRLLGFDNYLYCFSRFKSAVLRFDSKEGDFNHFLSMLPANATVLDIGANIGIMCSRLARRLRQGRVYAFEPMPDNMKALKRVVQRMRLSNVVLLECALGNENTGSTMIMPVIGSVRMQGLSHMVDKDIAGYDQGQTFNVTLKRLDDLPELQQVRVDAIKIDAENFEYQVFLGARNLIGQSRPLIYCELWDNENRSKCFALMKELGYTVQVLQKGKLLPFEGSGIRTQNFFFIPG